MTSNSAEVWVVMRSSGDNWTELVAAYTSEAEAEARVAQLEATRTPEKPWDYFWNSVVVERNGA